jgi:hypothetical protein
MQSSFSMLGPIDNLVFFLDAAFVESSSIFGKRLWAPRFFRTSLLPVVPTLV